VGRCPDCNTWGTVNEVAVLTALGSAPGRRAVTPTSPAVPITSIDPGATRHFHTGISELDRVLGGGLVPGSVTLLAGDPGVGKSTLLLEVAHRWAQTGRRALYLSGEESAGQIRLRAERTGCTHDEVFLAAESDLQTALGHIEEVQPTLVVVDSVQTMSTAETDGVTGGVTQVRAVTTALTMAAKTTGIAMLLVGHVTKDGAIAGPRVLEHLVDVVLHFEGERSSRLRMIRAVKNRFGPVDEVGCFDLSSTGIVAVTDPSGLFIARHHEPVAGTCIAVTLEGRRPMLTEVQALVSPTASERPRRTTSGIDSSRASMLVAVLQQRAGIRLHTSDVFVSTVGGAKITEPAGDLATALAVASAWKELAVPTDVVAIGEIGLAGELRRVRDLPQRLAEAARLGFGFAIVPSEPGKRPASVRDAEGMQILEAADLNGALRVLDLAGRRANRPASGPHLV
jgi:DNA repair protein RadA/Sms